MKKLLLVVGLLLFCVWHSKLYAAYSVVTYANGRVMRDAEGNIYNHRGEIFIRNNGQITYPSWQGGKTMRANEGWGTYPFKLYYPNGAKLAEFQYQLYYPTPQGATRTAQMYNGWTYTFANGQEILSNNWTATEAIYHSNSVKAWDGARVANPANQTVGWTQVMEPIGNFGYVYLLLDGRSGKMKLTSDFVFDLFQSSYIYPIVFHGSHSIPQTPFEKFVIQIETGYWGELMTVSIDKNGATSRFEISQYPVPEPWPVACASQIANFDNRPRVMAQRTDLKDFRRAPRR